MTDFQPFSHCLTIFSCLKWQCFDFPRKFCKSNLTTANSHGALAPSYEKSLHLTPVGLPCYCATIGWNDALEASPGFPGVFRIVGKINNGQSSLDAKCISLYANFMGMTNLHTVCNIKLTDYNHESQIMMLITQFLSFLILRDSGLPLVFRIMSATIT